MWLRVLTVTLSFVVVCGYVSRSESKPETTGIAGVIMVTPARPGPIRAGSESPKAAPLANATFTVTNDTGGVIRFTTDALGRFEVLLQPGRYVVLLAENRFPKPCGPFQVTVDPGKMTAVEWRCDSGMR
jgi:hypothetical protein